LKEYLNVATVIRSLHMLIQTHRHAKYKFHNILTDIYFFQIGMFQFGLRLAMTSYRRRHHGDASSASLHV